MKALNLGIVLLSFGLLAVLPGPACAISTISIQPSISTRAIGNVFDVDVDASSVNDLFAFQFDITFDPSVLLASSIVEGALLPTGGTTSFVPGMIDNTAGTVSFTADTLTGAIPGISKNGTLASVSFQAVGLGNSSVSLSNVVLLDSNLVDIAFGTVSGTVNVIPEPTSCVLIAVGILGMGVLRRGYMVASKVRGLQRLQGEGRPSEVA